jgi:hypothetical protein
MSDPSSNSVIDDLSAPGGPTNVFHSQVLIGGGEPAA